MKPVVLFEDRNGFRIYEEGAKEHDGEVDWRADKMAIGRWINEIGDLT